MNSKKTDNVKPLIVHPRNIGLANNALWLIAISAVFMIWSLAAMGTQWASIILVITVIVIAALIVISILVIRSALRSPIDINKKPSEKKKIILRFVFVVAIEVIAFSVVNPVVGAAGHYELLPSLNLIIVGIHFLPLAWIFRVQRYYITGLLFCVIPLITLFLIPKEFEVGHVLAWYVIPSLGCGLVAILTAAAGLREAWKSITESRTSAG